MRMNILRHDRWYTEIMHTLFDYFLEHTHKPLDTRSVGKPLFRWISANFYTAARQGIRRILLHPHVRLYRIRAELGRMDWQSLHSHVTTNSMDLMNKESPNVFSTYPLHGQCRPDSSELQKNMAYNDKAHAMRKLNDVGVRMRMRNHRDEICKARKYLETDTVPPKKKVMWAYERLAHMDIDKIDYGALSVLPFFAGNDLEVIHFHCLLALAETIEIFYLEIQIGRGSPQFSVWWGCRSWSESQAIW